MSPSGLTGRNCQQIAPAKWRSSEPPRVSFGPLPTKRGKWLWVRSGCPRCFALNGTKDSNLRSIRNHTLIIPPPQCSLKHLKPTGKNLFAPMAKGTRPQRRWGPPSSSRLPARRRAADLTNVRKSLFGDSTPPPPPPRKGACCRENTEAWKQML